MSLLICYLFDEFAVKPDQQTCTCNGEDQMTNQSSWTYMEYASDHSSYDAACKSETAVEQHIGVIHIHESRDNVSGNCTNNQIKQY